MISKTDQEIQHEKKKEIQHGTIKSYTSFKNKNFYWFQKSHFSSILAVIDFG